MNRIGTAIVGAILLVTASFAAEMEFVRVDDAGNIDCTTFASSYGPAFGSVDQAYRIGKYEVTNDEYVEFLNAKAASDLYAVYNDGMTTNEAGGILRSGSDGGYSYASKANFGNKPVVYISRWDAVRFVNWMHNGKGDGDTETGAYAITGGGEDSGTVGGRNPGALYFLPTLDEWFKAAYYDGGSTDAAYNWFATQNSVLNPTTSTADGVGNVSNPGANVATYARTANWNGSTVGNVTTVGSCSIDDTGASAYGTYDQSGNAWELPEDVHETKQYVCGGGYNTATSASQGAAYLRGPGGNFPYSSASLTGGVSFGFRVAAAVPDPEMAFVQIGDRGNAADTEAHGGFGAVAYKYKIGKYEVTNAEYVEFLNANAAADTYGLYDTSMGTDVRGGITRLGDSGSYTYTCRANMADKPVNFVSRLDGARFANWMHNGKGSGQTETGAYTITSGGVDTGTISGRNVGALYFLPNTDEWFKAAYYKGGGQDAGYWVFASKATGDPAVALCDAFGVITNASIANLVNRSKGADWNGQDGNVTTVGSAGANSASAYGTHDQNGNLDEILENFTPGEQTMAGGSWSLGPEYMNSTYTGGSTGGIRLSGNTSSLSTRGFRIAGYVPPTGTVIAVR